MASPAENTLARVRELVPKDWDPRTGDDGHAREVLGEVAQVLYRPAKVRARIIAYVDAHPGARMTEIRDALGLRGGQASGHLSALVTLGRLDRVERGVYRVPEGR